MCTSSITHVHVFLLKLLEHIYDTLLYLLISSIFSSISVSISSDSVFLLITVRSSCFFTCLINLLVRQYEICILGILLITLNIFRLL